MTKERQPLTPHRALIRIADLIGYDGCAEAIEKSEWTVRKLGDPDTGRAISFRDACRLDAAFRRAGGVGSPFLECLAARVGIMVDEGEDDGGDLLDSCRRAVKETGEAVSVALEAAGAVGDTPTRLRAVVEAEEGIAALQSLLFILQRGAKS